MATAARAEAVPAVPDAEPYNRAEVLRQFRTPRWIALTVVVLAASVLFGIASNWQYQRAIGQVQAQRAQASLPVPIDALVPAAAAAVPDDALGRRAVVAGDYRTQAWVPGRAAADGRPGFWLVAGVDDGSGTLTAVLRGWLPAKELPAGAAGDGIIAIGRVHSDENFYVGVPSGAADEVLAITTPNLAALWQQPLRPGYLVLDEQDPARAAADPAPVPPVFGAGSPGGFPWQNAGYALQWLVFIGFAAFMYWRWFRDDLQRAREDRAASQGPGPR
jgi:cytochrome oxidase assembly protein ShyY1